MADKMADIEERRQMGTSTDGLLWFGVAIDGSPDDGDEAAGAIHKLINGDADAEEYVYGDGREWLEENGLSGVEFVDHCSIDYPMYGIAVAGTVTRARRGYPQAVSPGPGPDPAPVLAVLKVLSIELDERAIGWHLASYWG